ncbi:MAG: hypothetical protein K9G76_07590 [Bacteroidales bacterium]|nr:hypothetical protein [Bacteroidales bacterium]MCF8405441.1 hypothetical protein [Bacteroidales bacterium]
MEEDNNLLKEKDVLGMDKPTATNTESYTSLGKVLNWKVAVLIVLAIVALYLIYQSNSGNKDTDLPSPNNLELNEGGSN